MKIDGNNIVLKYPKLVLFYLAVNYHNLNFHDFFCGMIPDIQSKVVNFKIISNIGKSSIPVVRIENKCKVLPNEFSRLDSDENRSLRFNMCPGLLVYYSRDYLLEIPEANDAYVEPCCPPIKSEFSIPPHIINTYIEYIIKKGDTCPIELTDLTMENICMTSCGHVMTKNALETWLNKFHSCPVCRKPLNSNQIYFPKDSVIQPGERN